MNLTLLETKEIRTSSHSTTETASSDKSLMIYGKFYVDACQLSDDILKNNYKLKGFFVDRILYILPRDQ